MPVKLTHEDVVRKLKEAHGDVVTIDLTTYCGMNKKCKFIDKDYGEWWASPNDIINRGSSHLARAVTNRQETLVRLYGADNPSKCPELRARANKTCLERFGSTSSFGNKEVREKGKLTKIARFGTEFPMQNKDVRAVAIKTNMEKFGTEWPLQNKEVQEKIKQTNLDRFGTETPLENKDIQDKIRKTNIERYGKEYPMLNKEVQERAVNSSREKYGTDYPAQNEEIQARIQKTNMDRYGVISTLSLPDVQEKIKKTNQLLYGNECAMKNHDIALKAARSANNATILYHWKTGVEIVCVASYEVAVVNFLNTRQINYEWQAKTFVLPDERTYRPDLYLTELGLWVEIKGYFRDDALEKWEWFHVQYPNSELWDEIKLKELGIL